MPKLIVAIPVFNEERHINRVFANASRLSNSVFFFDSGSTDKTISLVQSTTATLITVPPSVQSFAEKMNFIYTYPAFVDCVIFALHADEILDCRSAEILTKCSDVMSSESACIVTRQSFFLGRPLRWGRSSQKSIRLAGFNAIYYQDTPLDELIYVKDNDISPFRADIKIIDSPLINPLEWFAKHNRYSSLESELICSGGLRSKSFAIRLYYCLPIFVRPFILFVLRYFFFLGFLDGLGGLAYHLSHSLVYRLMVDVKIFHHAFSCRPLVRRRG